MMDSHSLRPPASGETPEGEGRGTNGGGCGGDGGGGTRANDSLVCDTLRAAWTDGRSLEY